MKITLTSIETGEVVTAPVGGYAGDQEGIVIGVDGKVYELTDNGACGDPECCGERSYYFADVTSQYKLEIEP